MLAQDLLDTFTRLEDLRRPLETLWRGVEKVVPPLGQSMIGSRASVGNSFTRNLATRQVATTQNMYDTTMMRALDRLVAGVYSLSAPSGEKWHGISTMGVVDEETNEEAVWAERIRDLMFHYRYLPKSRFEPAYQTTLRSTCTYGQGYLYIEPTFDPRIIAKYRSLPIDEVFVDKDEFGNVHTLGQRFNVRANNVKEEWDVSPKVTTAAQDPAKAGEEFEFIKVILPRNEKSISKFRNSRDSEWVGYTVEVGQKKVVYEEAFETFPVACFYWDDYGSSPCISYMNDQRMLNAMEKDVLTSLQQAVRPATGGPDSGLLNRPNLSPGAHNPGAVTADGKQLLIPLTTGGNPERVAPFMEQRRGHMQDGLYNSLFQLLAEKSGQTATEVLQRSQEKAQLLGPVGARLHTGLDMMIEREQEALELRGIYAENSPFLPPESLEGRSIRPTYTNPLVRMQRAGEGESILRAMEVDAQRQQMGKPSLLDDVKSFDRLLESFGTPKDIMRPKEDYEAEVEQRSQAQQQQEQVQTVQGLASAAKDGLPVAEAMSDAIPAE